MIYRNRILMNEADAPGGGNGATPSATPETPAQPAAQTPAAPQPIVDPDAIAAKVRDSLFAELRKAGVFGKQKPAQSESATPAPQPQLDPLKMRGLDFAMTKLGLAPVLSQAQYERAHRDFAAEAPADAEAWLADYFPAVKTAAPQPQPVQAAPAPKPQPQNPHPVSDRGSPPPSQVPLVEQDLWTMSATDRAALIREKGIKWYTDKLKAQGKGRAVQLR